MNRGTDLSVDLHHWNRSEGKTRLRKALVLTYYNTYILNINRISSQELITFLKVRFSVDAFRYAGSVRQGTVMIIIVFLVSVAYSFSLVVANYDVCKNTRSDWKKNLVSKYSKL